MHPDIFAISSCDIDESIYLDLPNKNGPLQSSKPNWFGKILMKLGLSTSSKSSIIDYIAKKIQPKDIHQLQSKQACHILLRLFKKEKCTQIDNLRMALYDRIKKISIQLELSKKPSIQSPPQIPTEKKIPEEITVKRHLEAPKICIDLSDEAPSLSTYVDSSTPLNSSAFHSGIHNTGASCYMNAALQALIRIPYFLELLQNTSSEFTSGIKQTLHLMKNEKIAVSYKNAQKLLFHFCAHGWLKFLENPSQPTTKMASAIKFYEEFLAEKLNLKFKWSLNNTTATQKSETPAINIHLNHLKNNTTLQDIIENYPTNRGEKKIYLTKEHAPEILPFFLLGKNQLKTPKQVAPSLTISLPTDKENCPLIYDLASVLVHEGSSIDSGHFFTFSLEESSTGKKIWVCYNDHQVHHYEINDAQTMKTLSTKGCALFYKKKSIFIEDFLQ